MTFTTAMTKHVPFSSPFLRDAGYINGVWTAGGATKTFDVINPATGEVLASLPDMGAAETTAAIDAAYAAQAAWAARPAKERSAILRKWFDLMVANADELGAILTAEMGKPLPEARGEILYAASYVEWYAEEAKRIYGETIPAPSNDKRMLVIRQPVGVVGTITPWNFPAAMIARKVAPALAVGCTVVSKPAEQTPLSAIALAVLAEQAGIPAGVFNVIVGIDGPAIGQELCGNAKVRKISFTGSTEVGRILMRQCSDQIKKVSLELGGNAPFIVFDDADVEAAVDGAMIAKMRNGGEACTAANRFYVHDAVADAFTTAFAARMARLNLGAGLDEGTDLGPLVNADTRSKVSELVDQAAATGSKVLMGGSAPDRPGYFYLPTVLSEVPPDAGILGQEIFGPVAPMVRFTSEDEVIALANGTEYGLVSYLYSADLRRSLRVAEALEAGMVGINRGIVSDPAAPFGGVKQSGIGREGGHEGLLEFSEIKYIAVDW